MGILKLLSVHRFYTRCGALWDWMSALDNKVCSLLFYKNATGTILYLNYLLPIVLYIVKNIFLWELYPGHLIK